MSDSLTLFEFDSVFAGLRDQGSDSDRHFGVPQIVYDWLKKQCLGMGDDAARWLKLIRKNGGEAIQFTGYAGVLRTPDGFQFEVLPKTGKATNEEKARALLINMLKCLPDFRHYKTPNAKIQTEKMPLMEVFIQQFLLSVESIVQRGLRSDYVARQDSIFALRGKLIIAQHLKQNIVRRDRFFTEHDEFSPDRAENRLLHTALRRVLKISRSAGNQKLARELGFVFNEIPGSSDIPKDFQRIRLDRGMSYYAPALDWSRLILSGYSPLTGIGKSEVISLMFPMAKLFEAYVAKHLQRRLPSDFKLKAQVRGKYLVEHKNQRWFRLEPDLLIKNKDKNCLILDTKWKLLNSEKDDSQRKYDLSQSDFYQLFAYGKYYFENGDKGALVLIYPKTDSFNEALPEFLFNENLPLWVLPFCLETQRLIAPIHSNKWPLPAT